VNTATSIGRTKNYFKQLKSSFIFKVLTILCGFLTIPLMIKYLGDEQYGIWSTLLSMVSWIVLFDIGIGNGLRNKISESLAKENTKEAQSYISTAYVLIGCISLVLLLVFLVISEYIPWLRVFNTSIISENDLRYVINITASILFINFWLSLINQVFNGIQKTSLTVFNQFLSNTFAIISIFILYKFFESSLVKLATVYGLSLLLSSILLSFWFFTKNTEFIPKIKNYAHIYTKSITSLGFQFFIIQIAYVIIFTTDKMLITQLFGPEYVTGYDVVFKLFSVITIAHSLLLAPLWAAYSDAYHREDFEWIQKTIKIQLKIYVLFILGTILLMFLAQPIISIWIGKDFVVDKLIIISIGFFVLISVWCNIFSYYLNATNKLNVQIYSSVVAMVCNIPLSIYLVKQCGLGIEGVVFGTVLSLSLFAIFGSLQTYNLVFKKKSYEK